ncbi:MAG: alpha/beta hydrolase [Hyphomicrobiales bacterium]|nr:alpha/beta hydrolase [Hyphomicrobiales bacterium]PCJ91861.1 MAG: alpha/beta hydrolase [Hyphomicrobiales bacterium]
MNEFDNDGVALSYFDRPSVSEAGQRDIPVLLIHGFASNAHVNWVYPTWTTKLTRSGYRVVALDNRGHGSSQKIYEPAAYSPQLMAGDARALLDHLDIEQAHVMGYSMGARLSAFLALKHPERVRSVVFGGLGMGMVHGVGSEQPIVDALLEDDPSIIRHEVGKRFRAFADATKSDRRALAACMASSRQQLSVEEAGRISVPTLVAVGTKDDISGSGAEFAALIPGAQHLELEGRDHQSSVGDKNYKNGVLAFYEGL